MQVQLKAKLIVLFIPATCVAMSSHLFVNLTSTREVTLRDAVIKENPVLSGILQKGGGGGSRAPPVPDLLHVNQNSRKLGGGVNDQTNLSSRYYFGKCKSRYSGGGGQNLE